MADGHAATGRGNDLGILRGRGQLFIVRQRNPIDDQDSNTGTILHADTARIGDLPRSQGNAARENEFFLSFGPLTSKRQKVLECFLINHVMKGAMLRR